MKNICESNENLEIEFEKEIKSIIGVLVVH